MNWPTTPGQNNSGENAATRVAVAEDSAGRLERATDVLRADVWGANEVVVKDSRLLLTDGDGRTVEWRTGGEGGDLVRAAGGEERRPRCQAV